MVRLLSAAALLLALSSSACESSANDVPATPYGGALADDFGQPGIECVGTVRGGAFQDASGAQVLVDEGVMPVCANVTSAPTIALAPLPEELVLRAGGETNVTAGGQGYLYESHGERGFSTIAAGAVKLRLPFATELVPPSDQTSLRLFVRVFDPDARQLVDLHGQVDAGGFVEVELRGLPRRCHAAVVHAPGRRAIAGGIDDPRFAIGDRTPVPPWGGRAWCAVYDWTSIKLQDTLKARFGYAGWPTEEQVRGAVQDLVVRGAVVSQRTYEQAKFRAPFLYIASDASQPCGDSLGTQPRYTIQLSDSEDAAYYLSHADEPESPSGKHYGRIYLNAVDLAEPNAGGRFNGVTGIIAHELLHAVQRGYDAITITTNGFIEGPATVYGMTIGGGGATILQRTALPGEIQRLDVFLMNWRDVRAYANQDFFGYFGRQYAGGSLAYLASLYDALADGLDEAALQEATAAKQESFRAVPPYSVFMGIADRFVWEKLSIGLKDIYLDFVLQRALEHNPASRFGRDGEITSGLAANLFNETGEAKTQSLATIRFSLDACQADQNVVFEKVCSYAARAVRILPANQTDPPQAAQLTITVAPSSAPVGSGVSGYLRAKGELRTIEGLMQVDSFGSSSDEVDLVVANTLVKDGCSENIRVTVTGLCGPQGPSNLDGCGSSGNYACNYHPSRYYFNRMCEEYTGTKWASDPTFLQNSCNLTNDSVFCTSGCPREKILGVCRTSYGAGSEVEYVYYTDIDYTKNEGGASDPVGDPAAYCVEHFSGTWTAGS